MAISGNSSYPPSVRVSVYNKELHLGIPHNVPPEVAKTAQEAADMLIANPHAMPYVRKEEISELWYLLYLADLIDNQDKVYVFKAIEL